MTVVGLGVPMAQTITENMHVKLEPAGAMAGHPTVQSSIVFLEPASWNRLCDMIKETYYAGPAADDACSFHVKVIHPVQPDR